MKQFLFLLATSVAICTGCAHNHNHDHETTDPHNHMVGESHDPHAGEAVEETGHHDEIIFPAEQAARTDFEVQTVKESYFAPVIHCSGEITNSPNDQLFLYAPVSGIVIFGDQNPAEGVGVTPGETLFYISTRGLASGNAVVKAQAAYEKARADYERAQALQTDHIVSQKEVDAARAEFLRAEAEYLPLASESKQGVPVKVPQSGYLTQLTVNAGQYVEAGTPLTAVTTNRRLRLTAEVPQRYYNRLADMTNAYFSTEASDSTFTVSELNGRRLSIGRSTAAGSTLIPVTFEFDNPGDLVSGLYAEVALSGKSREKAIVLPLSALTEAQGIYYVYVQLDEEGYQRREVTVGDNNGREVTIAAGLQPGERVVTRGAVQVKMAAASGTIPHGHTHNH